MASKKAEQLAKSEKKPPRSTISSIIRQFKDGVWYQNPNLVLLLGMCPTLAASKSLVNAAGMGVSVIFVLMLSNTIISLLRKFIPDQIRIASYVVIIAGLSTVIDLVLQAYLPAISESLGIFIPLIVVNCVILARAESFASKNPPLASAIDGIATGLGFMLTLIILALFRESLGSGTLFAGTDFVIDLTFGGRLQPAKLLTEPMGGFLTLGFAIAAMQFIMSRSKKKGKKA